MKAAANNDLEHERNIQHIGKVEMVRKEVDNVNLKRKRTYSENYQIIQNMKGRTLELRNLLEKKEPSSNSRKKQLSNVKISMVNTLKQILNDTNRAKKSHRLLHSSIAKLGKSIDKHFEPDLFLFKPSNNMTKKEMLHIRQHINHSVTTHIAMAGANVIDNDGPETAMNKYNKDSEPTNNNKNKKKKNSSSGIGKKKSSKKIIAINLFDKEMDNNNGSSKNNNGSASEKKKTRNKEQFSKIL